MGIDRSNVNGVVYKIFESTVIRDKWYHEYNGAFYPSLERAKAAAQADYAGRTRSTFSAQVQDTNNYTKLAGAIEACDWTGCSIGNKAILRATVEALRNAPR